jgi:hypothetical protein
MSERIVAEYLGLKPPKVFNKVKHQAGSDPSLLYGVELEIEGLHNEGRSYCVAGMQDHEDGSLRNNGREFVTSPMNFANLEVTLNEFFAKNKFSSDNYSERCSVHVHANCQDMTLNQVRLVVSVYQVLEKVLFNFIKDGRDENIFCVPISETIIGSQIMSSAEELFATANRKWRKYTALNLLPIYSYGTIEFRHMAGTSDVNRILQWCDIIGSMFKYAKENKYDDVINHIKGLNTSSAYGTFMQSIFPGYLYDRLAVGNFREFLEEGVINMKYMLIAKPKTKENSVYVDVNNNNFRGEVHDDVQAALGGIAGQLQARAQAIAQPQPRDPRLNPIQDQLNEEEQRRLDAYDLQHVLALGRRMNPGELNLWIRREAERNLANLQAARPAARPIRRNPV